MIDLSLRQTYYITSAIQRLPLEDTEVLSELGVQELMTLEVRICVVGGAPALSKSSQSSQVHHSQFTC